MSNEGEVRVLSFYKTLFLVPRKKKNIYKVYKLKIAKMLILESVKFEKRNLQRNIVLIP